MFVSSFVLQPNNLTIERLSLLDPKKLSRCIIFPDMGILRLQNCEKFCREDLSPGLQTERLTNEKSDTFFGNCLFFFFLILLHRYLQKEVIQWLGVRNFRSSFLQIMLIDNFFKHFFLSLIPFFAVVLQASSTHS